MIALGRYGCKKVTITEAYKTNFVRHIWAPSKLFLQREVRSSIPFLIRQTRAFHTVQNRQPSLSSAHRHSYPTLLPILIQTPFGTMANSRKPTSAEALQVVTNAMEKPSLDIRSYRVIRLLNQLEVLLIHDPETDKASAALDVNVGSFSDPKDMPGLAHAVEHMLFMGTEKVNNHLALQLDQLANYS
jgi:hypothetical protein